MKSKLPAEPKVEDILAIVDKREQRPLDLSPLQIVKGTLATGDYSVVGLESVVAVERKSLGDLLCCVGTDRPRFNRQVKRMLGFPCRILVVETSWAEMEAGAWRQKITPACAIGTLLGIMAHGLPVALVNDHEQCGQYVARFLFICARRRWREARALLGTVPSADGESENHATDSEVTGGQR
jgi:DNA excision repair protein ERCC-4